LLHRSVSLVYLVYLVYLVRCSTINGTEAEDQAIRQDVETVRLVCLVYSVCLVFSVERN